MNRHERRKNKALGKAAKPLPPARADRRPLFYDINFGDRVTCYHCERVGIKGQLYGRGEAFMSDPANTPDGSQDLVMVCKHHLPENAVIYDATTNLCRDKSGENTWMEDAPEVDSSAKIAKSAGVQTKS